MHFDEPPKNKRIINTFKRLELWLFSWKKLIMWNSYSIKLLYIQTWPNMIKFIGFIWLFDQFRLYVFVLSSRCTRLYIVSIESWNDFALMRSDDRATKVICIFKMSIDQRDPFVCPKLNWHSDMCHEFTILSSDDWAVTTCVSCTHCWLCISPFEL